MTKVKICGIRDAQTALQAAMAGADYIGLNFVPGSRRRISPEVAQEIMAAVQGKVAVVGVFQNAEIEEVNRLATMLGLDFVQLHGQESPDYVKKMTVNVIKALPLPDNATAHEVMNKLREYACTYFLLDRPVQGYGPAVHVALAREVAKQFPVFLAGGLQPLTVAAAVAEVRPYAVDVAGGIELGDWPDPERMRHFIQEATTGRMDDDK